MARSKPGRDDRQSGVGQGGDQRSPGQTDRDRILYSTAFRRLAGVTQVVSPGEGEVFHNRLTHSIKVAQIARRLAEMLLARGGGHKMAESWGGISPDTVEAAALAHDLGHPPFGHIAEVELNALVSKAVGESKAKPARKNRRSEVTSKPPPPGEGYEGNAQSFRIATRLDVRRPGTQFGLDLTRATLNAILKYPWLWKAGEKKYGAYANDRQAFDFAREVANPAGTSARAIEAQIMDWADDITYSVHDTEDFYRAGLIPLDRLAGSAAERGYFQERALARWEKIGRPFTVDGTFLAIFNGFFDSIRLRGPYSGRRRQREELYEFTSRTINDYVQGTILLPPDNGPEGLQFRSPEFETQIALLKELTWCYVIQNPALAALQHGQQHAIRTLFAVFDKAAEAKHWSLFPPSFQDEAEELARDSGGTIPVPERVRLVADTIASMTDVQAIRMYQRFTGLSQGSVLDPILT